MKAQAILKKEYFDDVILFDFEALSHASLNGDTAIFSFKNSAEISIKRNPKDKANSLREIFLDIYSAWRNYVESMAQQQQVIMY